MTKKKKEERRKGNLKLTCMTYITSNNGGKKKGYMQPGNVMLKSLYK